MRIVLACLAAATLAAADAELPTRAVAILAEHCVDCHGADKQKGELRLDSLAAALQGGEQGAAIVPGDPARSALVSAVTAEDVERRMPPAKRKQLTAQQVADLVAWVKAGAAWPAATATSP